MNDKERFDNKYRQLQLDHYQYQRKYQAYLKEQEYLFYMSGVVSSSQDILPIIGMAKIGSSKIG